MGERFLIRVLSRIIRKMIRHHKILLLLILLVFAGLVIKSVDTTQQNIQNTNIETTQAANVDSNFKIHYIDVGQGDASLIVCNGETMLIDAGDNEYGMVVVDYIKNLGINHLDYVVGTHPDADHVGGLDDVIYNIDCNVIVLSEKDSDSKTYNDVLKAIKETGNKYAKINYGDSFNLGDALVKTIGPVKSYKDSNNNSIAFMISYDNKKFLFMGDTEKEGEKDILSKGTDVKADVLKCAHHGSSSSSSYDFLKAVNPGTAIISCGKDNEYGHPHTETILRLQDFDIDIFNTAKQGTIILSVTDGKIFANKAPLEKQNFQEVETYILNTNTKKFHTQSCEHVNEIAESNKKIVQDTKENLIKEGYSPCGSCN